MMTCSVLHKQVPEVIGLLSSGQMLQIIPSEKLYHIEFMLSVVKLKYKTNINSPTPQLSIWICIRQIEWLGMGSLTYVEAKYANSQLYGQVSLDNAASVKVLKTKLKNHTIVMEPTSYVEYVAMKPLESAKVIFNIPSTNHIEEDVKAWDKVMKVYAALITNP